MDEQIVAVLRPVEGGGKVAGICCKGGISQRRPISGNGNALG
jgi:hypothetical protein